MSLREEWRKKHGVSWSDGTFDSVERFVRNRDENEIRAFVNSGDLDDLFSDGRGPEPRPIAHKEYMQEYAESYLNE